MTSTLKGTSISNPSDSGWCIGEVSFAWDEDAPSPRSAPELYALFLGHPPTVVLSSRVPTVSLPYLGYAAGDGAAAAYEVSVHGRDHAARVRLRRRDQDLPWDRVVGVTRDLDSSESIGWVSRRIEMELWCAAGSKPAARLVGSSERDAATLSRWFGDTRRQELASPMAGELAVERLVMLDYGQSAGREVLVRAAAVVHERANPSGPLLPWSHLLDYASQVVAG